MKNTGLGIKCSLDKFLNLSWCSVVRQSWLVEALASQRGNASSWRAPALGWVEGRNSPDFFCWVTEQRVLRWWRLQEASISQPCFRKAVAQRAQYHCTNAYLSLQKGQMPRDRVAWEMNAGSEGLLPRAWWVHPFSVPFQTSACEPLVHTSAPEGPAVEMNQVRGPNTSTCTHTSCSARVPGERGGLKIHH